MNRNFVIVNLWPEDSLFEGKRIHDLSELGQTQYETITAAPDDMELLINQYQRLPGKYHAEAARSLVAALAEWREAIAIEDEERAPVPYPEHVERRPASCTTEGEPYDC